MTEIQYKNNFQLKIKIKQKIFHFKLHKNILYNDTTFSTKNSIPSIGKREKNIKYVEKNLHNFFYN